MTEDVKADLPAWALHSDFCPWHVHWDDADCKCGVTGPRDPNLGLIEIKPGMFQPAPLRYTGSGKRHLPPHGQDATPPVSRVRAADHADNCDWHLDQYDFECTCGAVADPDSKRPASLRAAPASDGEPLPRFMQAMVDAKADDAASIESVVVAVQSRADSFMEALTNIVIGLLVSQVANLFIIPLVMGVPISAGQNFTLAVFYTLVSLARGYSIRRLFNGRAPWAVLKGAFA